MVYKTGIFEPGTGKIEQFNLYYLLIVIKTTPQTIRTLFFNPSCLFNRSTRNGFDKPLYLFAHCRSLAFILVCREEKVQIFRMTVCTGKNETLQTGTTCKKYFLLQAFEPLEYTILV